MRKFLLGAVLVILGTPAMAQSATTIKVITPAVTANAGLRDLAMGFEKEMGIKVEIQTLNMAKMVDELKGGTPPADIVFLPYALMDQAQTSIASRKRVQRSPPTRKSATMCKPSWVTKSPTCTPLRASWWAERAQAR